MKKILTISLISLLFTLTSCNLFKDSTSTTTYIDNREYNISVYTTKGDKSQLLVKNDDLIMKQDNSLDESNTTLFIDDTILYQEMDGFGAALTESSAYLIQSLPLDKRNHVIKDLFSDEGISMNFVRIPMGASDFALSSYTYDDMPVGETDVNLSNFTIARDEQYVIPILQEAFTYNDQIKLLASPWSAPAWMKTSGNLNHGSLKPEYYEVYSNYFIKFIEAYSEYDLPIYAVTLQNEPLHESWSYPSMRMTNLEQRDFIKVIGPEFAEKGIDTKIITYDHNWDKRTYPYPIYTDPDASKYVAGTGFHCYAGEVEEQKYVNNAFPEKGIWFTECSGGAWATDFSSNISWNMENVFIGSINYFSKGVLLWNIALDESYGPKNGGCSNCRGVLEIRTDGTVKKNEEYYMIGHFSKFVDMGAKRIETKLEGNDNILATGFLNLNGDIILVIHNKGSVQSTINIEYDGLKAIYKIPGKATSTLIIHKTI